MSDTITPVTSTDDMDKVAPPPHVSPIPTSEPPAAPETDTSKDATDALNALEAEHDKVKSDLAKANTDNVAANLALKKAQEDLAKANATIANTPHPTIDISPDPLIANNQVRALIGAEIARLQQLAATPGNTPIYLHQVLSGPLHDSAPE